jgi:hypothetical protein
MEIDMSKTPYVLFAAMLGAAFVWTPAFAQSDNLFGNGNCRAAHVDQVLDGKVLSSEPVVVCKQTPKTAALVRRARPAAVAARPAAPPVPAHVVNHVAFNGAPDRECAMLNCPTYILTGVGD